MFECQSSTEDPIDLFTYSLRDLEVSLQTYEKLTAKRLKDRYGCLKTWDERVSTWKVTSDNDVAVWMWDDFMDIVKFCSILENVAFFDLYATIYLKYAETYWGDRKNAWKVEVANLLRGIESTKVESYNECIVKLKDLFDRKK